MYRNLLHLFALALLVSVFTSCGSNVKTLPVPKDAGFVLQINSPSIASKISWQEIKATGWFSRFYQQVSSDPSDTLLQKIMDDPSNSGINVEEEMVMFVRRRGYDGYIAFEGSIKDAAGFAGFSKKMTRETPVKEGDLNLIKDDDKVLTWNNDRFVFIGQIPFFSGMSRYDDNVRRNRLTGDSLVAFAKELYGMKGGSSLASDKKYATLIGEAGDMHMWVNSENLLGDMFSKMLSFTQPAKMLEGNITAATMNFQNGKISINARNYYNDELAKVYEKYKMQNIDEAALKSIPSDNVIAVFAMNYPPEGVKEFIKILGLEGVVNSFMGKIGYSVDEFIKANKGDLMVSVSDLEITEKTVTVDGYGDESYTYTTPSTDVKVLFAASIKDKSAFEKMVGVIKLNLEGLTSSNKMPEVEYSMNDKWFAAGNSKDQIDKFLAGGTNNNAPFVSKVAGHPMAFYVDVQKILKITEASIKDSTSGKNRSFSESAKMWEDIIAYGGELGDGYMTSVFEVNLVDKNTNSLKQLNLYFDRMISSLRRAYPEPF